MRNRVRGIKKTLPFRPACRSLSRALPVFRCTTALRVKQPKVKKHGQAFRTRLARVPGETLGVGESNLVIGARNRRHGIRL
jgi:hypothetical protein